MQLLAPLSLKEQVIVSDFGNVEANLSLRCIKECKNGTKVKFRMDYLLGEELFIEFQPVNIAIPAVF